MLTKYAENLRFIGIGLTHRLFRVSLKIVDHPHAIDVTTQNEILPRNSLCH